ncbi:nuclear pore complex protein Nup54 isoform X1 [Leptinotarsa decemlineata]|uniref:nuclear pore complex protein Nup54 isoform X1 n=1 Tax=Leptinotarsa decemlineata TaxID=7539 RepID=UPI003D30C718
MAFSFGSTPAKTPGFGTTFGTPTTSSTGGFGGFGSTFGTATSQPPAFGSTFGTPAATQPAFGTPAATQPAFGTPAATQPAFGTPAATQPAFGSTFGTATPSFGSAFGTPASSAPPSFGTSFGSAFGSTATSAAPAFGTSFGTQQDQSNLFGANKPSLFGTAPSTTGLFSSGGTGGLFGSANTNQPTGLFGSTATSTAPSLFGATSTPSLFGQPAASTTTTPFGAANTTATGFGGLFGSTQATTAPSLFGTSFGATTSTAPAFGGFGTTQTGFGGFGTQAPTTGLLGSTFGAKPIQSTTGQVQQTSVSKSQQAVASVYAINVFNDERDSILKKWNMLQACWGTGKGYYNSTQPPVEYDSQNPFYRFKAMGYNLIPEQENSEGIVKLIFNKKISELKNQQEVLKNGIGGILGNRPNLTVEINQIRAISENQTEVKIAVSEKGVTGCSRKIPATDLSSFLNQPVQKQQLSSVGITAITPFITPTKAELEEYLKHPPPGIDVQMWQAAIQDNPNPKKYIPVPINGFADLRSRMLHQEHQTGLHQAFLERVNNDITELKTRHSSSVAKITDLKIKFMELQHRILKILVKQESSRKLGIAIQPEEEVLRGKFEMMYQTLNNPKHFKGQVNELLAFVKLMDGSSQKQSQHTYKLDVDAQDEIKQLLKMEQGGITQLINIIQNDLEALNIINTGMKQMIQNAN